MSKRDVRPPDFTLPAGHVVVRRQFGDCYLPEARVLVRAGECWHLPADEARQHDAENQYWVIVDPADAQRAPVDVHPESNIVEFRQLVNQTPADEAQEAV